MVRETVRNKAKATSRGGGSSQAKPPVTASSHASSLSANNKGQLDKIAEWIKCTGGPDISHDDTDRLCKGPLADALRFMAEHMKGRSNVEAQRVAIDQMRQSSRLRAQLSHDSVFIETKSATSRLTSAQQEHLTIKVELEDRMRSLSESQREVDRLQATAQTKRLAINLLESLNEKESKRMARIRAATTLIERLESNTPSHNAHDTLVVDLPQVSPISTRVDSTKDVLAALHSYHIRSARFGSTPRKTRRDAECNEANSRERLRTAIVSATGRSEDDPRVVELFERFSQAAQRRAASYLRYRSPLPLNPERITSEGLDAVSRRLAEKEALLQRLSDQSLELVHSCAGLIQHVSIFNDITSPELCECLRKESSEAEGYVDALRLSITGYADGNVQDLQDGSVVLRRGKAWQQSLVDVRTNMVEAHEKELLVQNAVIFAPAQHPNSGKLLESYFKSARDTEEQLTTMLARKLEKSHTGDTLQKEIERLVKEVGIVGVLSGSTG